MGDQLRLAGAGCVGSRWSERKFATFGVADRVSVPAGSASGIGQRDKSFAMRDFRRARLRQREIQAKHMLNRRNRGQRAALPRTQFNQECPNAEDLFIGGGRVIRGVDACHRSRPRPRWSSWRGRGFSAGPAGSSRRAACTAGCPAKVFATAARQRTAATYGQSPAGRRRAGAKSGRTASRHRAATSGGTAASCWRARGRAAPSGRAAACPRHRAAARPRRRAAAAGQ